MMDGEEPFLRAIQEKPDDDGPRLVYADWLEEHGSPRGELIRVQCEMARMNPLAYGATMREYHKLLYRAQDIILKHKIALLPVP